MQLGGSSPMIASVESSVFCCSNKAKGEDKDDRLIWREILGTGFPWSKAFDMRSCTFQENNCLPYGAFMYIFFSRRAVTRRYGISPLSVYALIICAPASLVIKYHIIV